MAIDMSGRSAVARETCRYQDSRLLFRGPKRHLGTRYIAFLGGTETYGKFVEHPFPDIIEAKIGLTCVNLGWPNAGVDVLQRDPGLVRMAAGAALTVLQVPCAANLSNRYYTVHPRRNDRFVKATDPLRALYPEVDFTEFHFTRHMLCHLHALCPQRFARVHAELAQCWSDGMRRVIEAIETPVLLFWFSARKPEKNSNDPDAVFEPALVSRGMLDTLQDISAGLVECEFRLPEKGDTLVHLCPSSVSQAPHAARELPDYGAHTKAAGALLPFVTKLLSP